MRYHLFTARLTLLAGILGFAPFAIAEDGAIQPQVDLIYAGRTFIAIRSNAEDLSLELRPREVPLWSRASGHLGAIVTSQRFMVTTATAPTWIEKPLHLQEGAAEPKGYLSSNLVFISTEQHIWAYDAMTERFLEWVAPAGESVIAVIVAPDAGVIVLRHAVVGYAAGSSSFVVLPLEEQEVFTSSTVTSGNLAILTSTRELTFDGATSSWSKAPIQATPAR